MAKNVLKIPRKRPGTHGAAAYWRRGILPEGSERLAAIVDNLILEYVKDLGGAEQITAGQSLILNQIKRCLTFQMLVDTWLSKPGLQIVNNAGQVPPVLSNLYVAIMNSVVRYTRELGLKRVSPAADDLAGYLRKQYPAVYDVTQSKAKQSSTEQTVVELSCRTIDPGEVRENE